MCYMFVLHLPVNGLQFIPQREREHALAGKCASLIYKYLTS